MRLILQPTPGEVLGEQFARMYEEEMNFMRLLDNLPPEPLDQRRIVSCFDRMYVQIRSSLIAEVREQVRAMPSSKADIPR